MRLQHWTYRLARKDKERHTRETGQLAPEVSSRLYEALAALYSPLNASKKEIRTITVAPGSFEDDIDCRLSTVSLLDDPVYEALSYAWGDFHATRKCFIQGVRHQITQNLESALRYMRYCDKSKVLWIDALCIDQGNMDERNAQVKFMGTVYRQASQVIAWLGTEYNNSDLAFDFFNAMPSDPETHWDPCLYPSMASVLTMPHIDAVNNLFNRAWWQRIWTVQESVLPQTLRFVCGRKELLEDHAFKVGIGYFKHVYWCCHQLWRAALGSNAGLGDCCDTLGRLAEMRAHNDRYIFGEILSKFMPRHSSDPRDKIYGLIGLATRKQGDLIVPDYSKPIAQIYEEVALKLTEDTGELSILSMQYPKAMVQTGPEVHNMPSWVPNWALDVEPALLYDLEDRISCLSKYQASGKSRTSAKYLGNERLSVPGHIISHIGQLSDAEHHWDVPDLASFFKRWRTIAGILTNPNRPYRMNSSTTIDDAYWQTLCC